MISFFKALWILVAVTAAGTDIPAAANIRQLTLVSWNVENLFHPAGVPDHEWSMRFSPEGAARWTAERYQRKLSHLAETISRLQPDILCLQEVESRIVLEALQSRLKRDHAVDLPHIFHRHGEDFRGMDVAVMSRFGAKSVEWITPAPGRRDIQQVAFDVDGERLVVFNNHWKSRFILPGQPVEAGRAYNRSLRMREAQALRNALDAAFATDPAAAIVVAGDFNDDPEDLPLVDGARMLMDRAAVVREAGALYNLAAELPADRRGTFHYRWGRSWHTFDTLAVSRSLLPEALTDAAPWRVRNAGYDVVRYRFLGDTHARPLAFRRIRRIRDGRVVYQYGYSDHYPVRLVLVRRGSGDATHATRPASHVVRCQRWRNRLLRTPRKDSPATPGGRSLRPQEKRNTGPPCR